MERFAPVRQSMLMRPLPSSVTARQQQRGSMGHLNDLLFLLINAGAHPPEFLLSAALFLATWLVPLAILVFVLLWIRKGRPDRIGLISATITMLIALGVNQIIGLFYFHPRPFMIGLGHQYLPHPPDNSFPSDHATFLWSLGFALLALGALRAWAALLVMAGFAVAWARVYVGVHFPFEGLFAGGGEILR
ncbi:undecaprenyl-diphosphatase [Acidiphilium acidophilum]|uniref:Undecaprenyl-diphosphatase n=1 Tax=Acidiphilium acidophilum TaxID=76588 RepID=A0AAW9DL10_ACIAO|nr:undecaprenyl-diphosphatase [Acidiphilium acidophilum]MDX5929401.1 undecaprenyl-diphosphatase [Acidiphilium acidophilum]